MVVCGNEKGLKVFSCKMIILPGLPNIALLVIASQMSASVQVPLHCLHNVPDLF